MRAEDHVLPRSGMMTPTISSLPSGLGANLENYREEQSSCSSFLWFHLRMQSSREGSEQSPGIPEARKSIYRRQQQQQQHQQQQQQSACQEKTGWGVSQINLWSWFVWGESGAPLPKLMLFKVWGFFNVKNMFVWFFPANPLQKKPKFLGFFVLFYFNLYFQKDFSSSWEGSLSLSLISFSRTLWTEAGSGVVKGVLVLCQRFAFWDLIFFWKDLHGISRLKFHKGKDPIKTSGGKRQLQKPKPGDFGAVLCFKPIFSPLE